MNDAGGEALEPGGPASAALPPQRPQPRDAPLYASVAPPLPVPGLFTYEVPP